MSILEDALPSQRVYPGEPGYLKGRGHLKTTSVVCCCITNDNDGDDDMCCLALSMLVGVLLRTRGRGVDPVRLQ